MAMIPDRDYKISTGRLMKSSEHNPTENAHTPHDEPAKDVAAWPIILGVLLFVAGWGASIALWGVPGLYIPALATVPVIWGLLIAVSRG